MTTQLIRVISSSPCQRGAWPATVQVVIVCQAKRANTTWQASVTRHLRHVAGNVYRGYDLDEHTLTSYRISRASLASRGKVTEYDLNREAETETEGGKAVAA